MDLEEIRREYLKNGLRRNDLAEDPYQQFKVWMEQLIHSEAHDPTAMTLATVNKSGKPSQRIVLLKHIDHTGLVFYTNYASAKAQDMATNSHVSLHFPWHAMERQVAISGVAEKVSSGESLKYFMSRPFESRLSAWASKQSHTISSRAFLMSQFEAMKKKFANGEVPLPDFWGGYRVTPEYFEFWQGRANRLHDRFAYRMKEDKWHIERLAP